MPDSKITALTALTAADPANDMFPIVDVSDTSMAASGTTKRISINNLLAASGTATLASATITGDLTVDTNVLKVDSAGNRVSVNTTTFATDSAFAVKTTAGKFDVRAAGSLSVKLNSDQSMLYNVPTGNAHLFQINDSDAMTLNSTGLGVGVSPAFKIHANGVIGTTNTFGAFTALQTTGGTGYRWTLSNDNNFYLQYSPDGFGSTATSRIALDSSGNVGIGVTPSAGKGCLQLVSGINFPATQVASSDANTLDDYEEGTWTPVFADAVTGGNVATAASAVGIYTKVGNLVTVQYQLESINTTGLTAGNSAYVRGLPFSVTATLASPGHVMSGNVAFGGFLTSNCVNGGTQILFYDCLTGGSLSTRTVSNFTSGSASIYGSFTYRVA